MPRLLQSLTRKAKARRNRDGVAAIEFALVGLPFFFFLFTIFEIGLIFTITSVVDNATMQIGRQVRTGQAAETGMSKEEFKQAFCARMSVFKNDCAARTSIDVRELPRFEGADPPDPTTGATFDESKTDWDPGEPGSLILVRVWYRQPVFVPFVGQGLPRQGDYTLLTASTAFRNEPFT